MRFLPFASVGLAMVLVGCGNGGTEPRAARAPLDTLAAAQVLIGMEHTVTKDGVRQAFLQADSGYIRNVTQAAIDLRGVKLSFYDPTGRQTGTLTSRSGQMQLGAAGNGSMVATGKVVLRTGGRTIESEELNYYPDSQQIFSNKPTVMREGGRVVRGTSFRSDLKFENLNVAGAQTEGGSASSLGVSF